MERRFIHQNKTSQSGGDGMSTAAARMDAARVLLESAIKREADREGISEEKARDNVAGKMKVLPGTLYNLLRNRLKKLDSDVRDALTVYAIRDIQQEFARLEHELEMARRMGAHPASARMAEIETERVRYRKLLIEAGVIQP